MVRTHVMLLAPLMGALGLATAAADADPARSLVFALSTWEGEYVTSDVPGGVKTTPVKSQIYTIREDGTGLRGIETGVANSQNPQASPDGRWITFQSNASGEWQIYRCRPDGSGTADLTAAHTLGVRSFGSSPSRDGRQVVYTVGLADGTGRAAVMDADGANARIIAPDLGYHYMAALSPDGRRVVFSHTADGYRMKIMDLNGSHRLTLTPDHPDSYCGQFWPDGRRILFFRRDGDLYRVDADGANLTRLTTGHGYVEFRLGEKDAHGSSDPPALSPDGKRIACIARVDGVPQVHVMDADGAGKRQVTHLPGACGRVRWSRDGKQIAFVSFVGQYPQLFTIGAGGEGLRRLTDLPGAVYTLEWLR